MGVNSACEAMETDYHAREFTRRPDMPTAANDSALLASARALWQQNRVAEAEAILREINTHDKRREDVAMLLAEALRSQGRLDAACRAVFDLCNANGFPPDLSLRGATFARQCDRHAIAMQICEGALSNHAASSELLVLAGHVARESGDFETARARYLAALEAGIDLERNHVLGALVNTKRYVDAADHDIARCERHFRDAAYSARSRASAGFGLAKVQNDLGDYAAAACTLSEANAMVHGVWPWDAAAWRRFVDARRGERTARAGGVESADFIPVFVVGLPRTGTTLTATLLARTTAARDRGELRFLRYIAERLITGGHLGATAALTEAAQLYRAQSRQDDAPATWYIDQDPLNFRFLHVAEAMFPQAHVIHCRRDRRDTALSLWSQDFAHRDFAFAYDFGDIVDYAAGHDALMAHWQQNLSLPIHELDYEALVTDPEGTLTSLRESIGIPLSRVGAESIDAPVQSASVWQARQPIYSSSIGRWHAYSPYVPELEAVVGSESIQPPKGFGAT